MLVETQTQVDETIPGSKARLTLEIKTTMCAELGCDYCRGPETD